MSNSFSIPMVLITISESENIAFKVLSSNTFVLIISRLGISFKFLLASMFLVGTQILSHKGDNLADNCDPINPVPPNITIFPKLCI